MYIKRIISVALAATLVATAMPEIGQAEAAKKAPSVAKSVTVTQGKSKSISIKKGGYTIASAKWTPVDKKVVKITKKSATKATIKGVSAGSTKIKITVKTKAIGKTKAKKFNLKTSVKVKAKSGLQPASKGASKLDLSEYTLKWEDNFDGDKLNTDDWNVELHEAGWVNSELQEYVNSDENIQVKDGALHLKPKSKGDGKYTSGRVNTMGKHDFKYGVFEAKVKFPKGQGYLPAFWMMPTDESLYGQWPKCGEIDIAEVMGQETDKLYGTIHYGEPHMQSQGTTKADKSGKDYADDYHTYAVEWVPGRITWYVDGVRYYEARDWFSAKSGGDKLTFPAPFDQNFYMILNLAVGGSWVGDINEDTIKDMDNQEYTIDYVRAYQKPASSYNENVIAASNDDDVSLRDPDAKGNYIVNGDFKNDEDLAEDKDWAFKTALGGDASAKIKDGAITLKTKNAGTVDYSVQLVQNNLPIKKNATYELSFDASASEARRIKVAIQAPDRGWVQYLGEQTVDIGKDKKNYKYSFTMTEASDPNGRLDFNIGAQGSTADVVLSNIVLKKTADDVKMEKTITPEGNYIYNGSFDQGMMRLGNWEIFEKSKGVFSVTNENNTHRLKVVAPADTSKAHPVMIEQSELGLLLKGKYQLSYKAYKENPKDGEKSMNIAYGNIDFGPQALTSSEKTYTQNFDIAKDMDRKKANLTILFTEPGTYYLDDIQMTDNALLKNGSFDAGRSNWSVYVNSPADASDVVDSLKETNALDITVNDTGSDSEDWYIQLNQENINLEYGKKYRISFRAKSTVESKIQYRLLHNGENDNIWDAIYSGNEEPTVTNEWQTFTKEFTMEYETDVKSRFNITLGSVGGKRISTPHHVFIDDVVLEEIG